MEIGERAQAVGDTPAIVTLENPSPMGRRQSSFGPPPADEKEMQKQMKEAEDHAKKALTQVTALMNSPTAAQMKPEDQVKQQIDGLRAIARRVHEGLHAEVGSSK